MPKTYNQKLKLLWLYRILWEQTDDDHGLSMKEIEDALAAQGIQSARKSIYDDIERLREFGADIEYTKNIGYRLMSRNFELPELKLLVDAVQSSRFITAKKSRELIEKLTTLGSRPQRLLLDRQVYVGNRPKAENEQIYYNVDTLHEAIAKGKKVKYFYFEYTPDKRKVRRRHGGRYVENPVCLCWNDDTYYLVVYSEKYDDMANYRVDRMEQIEITDEDAAEIPYGFDAAEYVKKHFSMYGGEEQTVVLQLSNSLATVAFDRFGRDISTEVVDDTVFNVRLRVVTSPAFYGYLFQFGSRAKILGPDSVRAEYERMLTEALEK